MPPRWQRAWASTRVAKGFDLDTIEADALEVAVGLDLVATEVDAFEVTVGVDLNISGRGFYPRQDRGWCL